MSSSLAASDRPRPILLVVLDGFGIGHVKEADAIAAAHMPIWRSLLSRWPHATLGASGEAVGLPPGQMGNSEVGHLNLGAGRAVLPDLPRIDAAIRDGSIAASQALGALIERASEAGRTLHLISLIGPGGVHANDRHLVEIARLADQRGARRVRVHGLLDGRDTPPRSASGYLDDLERRIRKVHPDARLASLGGRYFAMDRDRRWDRTALGYFAIVRGVGQRAPSVRAAMAAAYERGESDEFVRPTVIEGVDGVIGAADPVLHCNFRADRARQLVRAFVDEPFDGFDRDAHGPHPRDLLVGTMTEYEVGLPVLVVFPPEVVHCLAEAFSAAGWRQFHIAETEKYAHVTYFFNGGREAPWPGEERLLVPSPMVATYDELPEMSAPAVTDGLVAAIDGDAYGFIVANYANPDMVGHTGVFGATVQACEAVDRCLARIVAAAEALDRRASSRPGSLLLVTSDHGNADEMLDPHGAPQTAHSLNPVPIVIRGLAVAGRRLHDGVLADVAPTILELAGLPAWPEIRGRSLLER